MRLSSFRQLATTDNIRIWGKTGIDLQEETWDFGQLVPVFLLLVPVLLMA